ncbi:lytic murein transglycosylase [Loktanella sp. D2R18]|uniref:lytic murein transglycosylase n=1 Tax=Rhodobacterales TaxID=204455 RepID=UPI000DE8E51B|nr:MULTISPECIES: lytic murein transglycosylase [Rhodobacterales]MDO6591009.1 lytic murein transglycosylase [Yoonia sp. 1_MG-2023]RBW42233.1 lytic murein transglycosylase [Loktanella sp. D2R18]
MRLAIALSLMASTATAQTCGGPIENFIAEIKSETIANGVTAANADSFFQGAQIEQSVLNADRSQGVFQKDFVSFSRSLISQNRIDNGRANSERYDATFTEIESRFGVPRGVLLAFWAFETDYGQVQGNFNTRNALLTLAHDCRRPELFRPQLLAALELYQRGGMDPANTTGAWAGEIGQVQMLPLDIIERGIDGDGDGVVTLKTSAPDALMSGANVLSALGWRANEPWLQEIIVPDDLDWSQTGLNHKSRVSDWEAAGITAREGALEASTLQASVLLPMGRDGPAFLAYPNFDVYFEWNKSFVYVTTAAYFATRLSGASVYDVGNPSNPLTGPQMQRLQERLSARGHDVGGIDGILGAMTRAAVQSEQQRLGLPADAWPTLELLNQL